MARLIHMVFECLLNVQHHGWCGLSTAVAMSELMKTVNSPNHLHYMCVKFPSTTPLPFVLLIGLFELMILDT